MARVLIYAPTVGRGGVRRVIETLCADLAKHDAWSFDVLGQAFDELGERMDWPEQFGFTQVRPVDRLPLHPDLFMFLMQKRGVFFEHLKEVAGDYDLVFCPSTWWGFIGTEPIDTPVVSFVPDFAFDHMDIGLIGQYFRGISPIIAAHSAHTVFPSDWQREHGETHYGFEGSTVYFSADYTAADFAVTDDNRLSVKAKYGLPDAYVFAFHCYGHKGAEVIVRGQHVARRASGEVPPLVMAGLQTGYYAQQPAVNEHVKMVQDTIRECSGVIGRDVFILGSVPDDDLGGLYAGAVCSVTATRSEGGLSGTVLESILAGVPVVASDLPVFRERLSHEVVSYFPVDDGDALGEVLVSVCSDADGYRERAARLRDMFTLYTRRDVVEQYMDVFREVLNGR